MKPATELAGIVFLSIIIICGFSQINFQNEIFANTLRPCCNAGYCHNRTCTTMVDADNIDNCETQHYIDCFECMDWYVSDYLCDPNFPDSAFCWNGTNKYYGSVSK